MQSSSLLHLTLKLKTSDAFDKIQGDIFIIDKRKYKVYSPPLRDNSGMLWKIQASGV
ncbi:head-tail joining protein [Wolbachia endosymbiont of Rhagoletis indifferens]|uniref:head-tail joining protein n=1 Tax=Wolbachia endosymbiont of Rhagoletis indifferens TaxID=3383250 RepID=UPI003AF35CB7